MGSKGPGLGESGLGFRVLGFRIWGSGSQDKWGLSSETLKPRLRTAALGSGIVSGLSVGIKLGPQ